jgi:hypothetical protein
LGLADRVFGVTCVFIAPEYPAVALGMPGLMLINTICLHISLCAHSRPLLPGLVTSALLFLPLGISTMK